MTTRREFGIPLSGIWRRDGYDLGIGMVVEKEYTKWIQ